MISSKRRVRSNELYLNVILLVLIVCTGCADLTADQWVYVGYGKVQLLKPSNSTPASTDNAVISGPITSDEKNRISRLVGRIPDISHEIEEIHVTRSNNKISALIWVHHYRIDAKKSKSGEWIITDFGYYVE